MIINIVSEDVIDNLKSAVVESAVHANDIDALCLLEEKFENKKLREFHNKKIQKSFSAFLASLEDFIGFTQVNLFPVNNGLNFTLRQQTKNGIEHNPTLYKEKRTQYYRLLDCMVHKYNDFIKLGKKYFKC